MWPAYLMASSWKHAQCVLRTRCHKIDNRRETGGTAPLGRILQADDRGQAQARRAHDRPRTVPEGLGLPTSAASSHRCLQARGELLTADVSLGTVPQVLVGRPGLSPVMVGTRLGARQAAKARTDERRPSRRPGERGGRIRKDPAGTRAPRRPAGLDQGLHRPGGGGRHGPPVRPAPRGCRPRRGEPGRPCPDGLAAWKDALGTLLGPVAPGLHGRGAPLRL